MGVSSECIQEDIGKEGYILKCGAVKINEKVKGLISLKLSSRFWGKSSSGSTGNPLGHFKGFGYGLECDYP
jgi:hypothetical protein